MLNKQTLIEKIVAAEPGITKAAAGRIVNTIFDSIVETVAEGGEARFVGFGTFKSVDAAAREARNPRTGETIQIPAKRRVKFSAGEPFKKSL